jgi:hypothetical protein
MIFTMMMTIIWITNMRYNTLIFCLFLFASGCTTIVPTSTGSSKCKHIDRVIETAQHHFSAWLACDLILTTGEQKKLLISTDDYRFTCYSCVEVSADFSEKLRLIKQCCCRKEQIIGQFDCYIVNDSLVNLYAQMHTAQFAAQFFPSDENDLKVQAYDEVPAAAFVLLQRGASIVNHTALFEVVQYPLARD